jgi:hypothetical protein
VDERFHTNQRALCSGLIFQLTIVFLLSTVTTATTQIHPIWLSSVDTVYVTEPSHNSEEMHSWGTIKVYSDFYNYNYIKNWGGDIVIEYDGYMKNDGTIVNWAGTTGGFIDIWGTFENSGTIENTNSSGGYITDDYTSSVIYSSGSFNNSGTINNDGYIGNSGTFDNSGTIVNMPSISGMINDFGGTLNNTNAIHNNSDIVNYGTINNSATINNWHELKNDDTGIVNNSGTINNSGKLLINYGKLDNSGTINNSVRLGNALGGTIENRGTINNTYRFDNAENGIINNRSGGTINNSDRFRNRGNSTINNWGTINNTGTIENESGSIINNSGTVNNTGTIFNYGAFNNQGVLKGTGSFVGNLYNDSGTVAPGNSAGTITIDGDFTLDGLGVLEIEIGGFTQGTFDLLDITGTAYLDGGSIELSFLSGYDIVTDVGVGQTWQLSFLSADGGIANFDSLINYNFMSLPGFQFDVFQSGNDLIFEATNNTNVVPAPSAALLVCIGVAISGWKMRRKQR